MTQWFYRLNETNQGPVSEDDLKHIFESGALPLTTTVWSEGMNEWVEAKNLKRFAFSASISPIIKKDIQPQLFIKVPKPLNGLKAARWGAVVAICICFTGVGIWVFNKCLLNRKSDVNINNQAESGVQFNSESSSESPLDVNKLRKSAEQGDSVAQCLLGLYYYEGEMVKKDYNEAFKLMRRSAEQGNARGQCCLGSCYAEGIGVIKDPAEAVKWYTKSAEQNYDEAQFYLGAAYLMGEGVEKDEVKGLRLISKAALQRNKDALKILTMMGMFRADRVAALRKSAERGNVDAAKLLEAAGYLSYQGGVGTSEIDALRGRGLTHNQAISAAAIIHRHGFTVHDALSNIDGFKKYRLATRDANLADEKELERYMGLLEAAKELFSPNK